MRGVAAGALRGLGILLMLILADAGPAGAVDQLMAGRRLVLRQAATAERLVLVVRGAVVLPTPTLFGGRVVDEHDDEQHGDDEQQQLDVVDLDVVHHQLDARWLVDEHVQQQHVVHDEQHGGADHQQLDVEQQHQHVDLLDHVDHRGVHVRGDLPSLWRYL